MRKTLVRYKWSSSVSPTAGTECEAKIDVRPGMSVIGYGRTFPEAKASALQKAKELPPDEEIEI
jgi:hypothetical protein